MQKQLNIQWAIIVFTSLVVWGMLFSNFRLEADYINLRNEIISLREDIQKCQDSIEQLKAMPSGWPSYPSQRFLF